jgi:hypothetical protein
MRCFAVTRSNALQEPCPATERYRRELAHGPADCRINAAAVIERALQAVARTDDDQFEGWLQNEERHMRLNALYMIVAAALALAGCNKAESPAEVQHDVTTAQADAQRDVADARADARENMADANKDVADAAADHDAADVADQAKDANQTAAMGDYKITVAQAEAAHKVATQKCEGLSGSAQQDCKDRADNELDHAKKQAEQRREGAG